jgi:hypothetical protein
VHDNIMKFKVHYESNLIMFQQLDEEDWIKSTLYKFSYEVYIYMQISKFYDMYYFVTNIIIHSNS